MDAFAWRFAIPAPIRICAQKAQNGGTHVKQT
jgi:hypothetical protein